MAQLQANDVHIKAIGTSNAQFKSGETDLRGVFVADDIRGKAMIIARAGDGQYAFYRGSASIGRVPATNSRRPRTTQQGRNKASKSQSKVLLEGVISGNRSIQRQQKGELDSLYKGLKGKPSAPNAPNASDGGGFGGGFGGGGIF